MSTGGVRAIGRAIATVWTLVPPIALSSLVHLMDPDVPGPAHLAMPAVTLSVLVVATPVVLLVCLCLHFMRTGGSVAGGITTVISASAIALVLTAWGSTAETIAGYAWSFLGLFAGAAAVLAIAVTPLALLEAASGARRTARVDSPPPGP